MERGHKIAVVINKIDRPDRRIDEVIEEVEDLLLNLAADLEIDDLNLDIPIFYASAKEGHARKNMEDESKDLTPLLDFMIEDYFSTPKIETGENLKLLVTNLTYSNYLGQQVIGRIQRGSVSRNQQMVHCDRDRKDKKFKVTNIQVFSALGTKEVETASAGEIVLLSGIEHAEIGDSVVSPEDISPIKRINIDPPTVSVTVSVNTSPNSGQEGDYLTSRKLEEFLKNACRHNVALKYNDTSDPKEFKLKGRGELQLAIVFEEIRREGFELMVARPKVLMKVEDGQKLEPFEMAVIDIPDSDVGIITESLSIRKGVMESLVPIGEGRTRLEFRIPSRGLIGYRGQFLTDTRGEGIMSSRFLEYAPYAGDLLNRQCGAILSDRAGKATPYALFNLLSSGEQFIRPGEKVFEGQVIGEHSKTNDINVNCIREKHLSSMRTAGKDENIIIPPIQDRTIDWAMNWIDDDEWVLITPKNIRVRKKVLEKNLRSTIRR